MKDKVYSMEVIVGVLVLIIFSLILKLVSLEVEFLPSWFFENLFLGLFTLVGAFFGAAVAGKYAVNSVEKQIESSNRRDEERVRKTIKLVSTEMYILISSLKKFIEVKDISDIETLKKYEVITEIVKKKTERLEKTLDRVDWMYIPLEAFIDMAVVKEIASNVMSNIEYLEKTFDPGHLLERHVNFAIWEKYINDLEKIQSSLEEV